MDGKGREGMGKRKKCRRGIRIRESVEEGYDKKEDKNKDEC